jgi:hypothetical protein
MTAFLLSLALFLLAFGLHVIWWRWQLPRHHTAALLCVFGLTPLIGFALWYVAGSRPALSWAELPGMALFYLGAAGCYLLTYAGIEETSPSLVIIRALERAGAKGCTKDELAGLITEERFVQLRLQALERDRLVVEGRLTPVGLRVTRFSILLAKVFNIHESA